MRSVRSTHRHERRDRRVDGGYGGVGLTAPLKVDVAEPQPSLFEQQRVARSTDELIVQAQIARFGESEARSGDG